LHQSNEGDFSAVVAEDLSPGHSLFWPCVLCLLQACVLLTATREWMSTRPVKTAFVSYSLAVVSYIAYLVAWRRGSTLFYRYFIAILTPF